MYRAVFDMNWLNHMKLLIDGYQYTENVTPFNWV